MPLGAIALTICMVWDSELAFDAAVKGLNIWWTVVFPALLPFFIAAEILMGLGVVHGMGTLLEPLMRPFFNVPGAGAFVVAMGLASGYPIGSILSGRLRQQGMVSKTEGERLMSFTNTADPLFMTGAVAVGMFGRPEAGVVIMIAHYTSSLLLGFIMRFYRAGSDQSPVLTDRQGNIILRALLSMHRARQKDGRPFGQLLGDAVGRSVNTLLTVGGFIIIFSVIIQILTAIGFVTVLTGILGTVLIPLGLHPGTLPALVSGLFEITLGTQLAGQCPAPYSQQLIAASAIIAWSGLSVHAQVAAMTQGTDLSIAPFIVARLVHAFLAGAIMALLFMGPAQAFWDGFTLPVFLSTSPTPTATFFFSRLTYVGFGCAVLIAVMLAGAIIMQVARTLRVIVFWLTRSR
ncbi:MAG: sporulation integral membrane protein YlbJ [Bacillota bacterium]